MTKITHFQLLAVFACFVAGAVTAQAQSLPDVIESVEPSILKVETNVALGSGFTIKDGLVVTNRHVIEGATEATVQFKDGRKHKVLGVVFDGGKLDICILKCKGLTKDNSKALQLVPAPLRQGESVFTFGAPQGLEFSVSEGIVSANRLIDDIAFVQITAPISSGNSGGPLLRVKDGSVVGINTWTRVEGQNLNFAIAASELRKAIDKISSEPQPLDLTDEGHRSTLEDEAKRPSFAALMEKVWQAKVETERKKLDTEIESIRSSIAKAESEGIKAALRVNLEHVLHEKRTVGSRVSLDTPKTSLSQLARGGLGSFGYVQDRMPILQILNEFNCLIYVDGVVFLLENFPTADVTTDTVLTAKEGPVMYISGTFEYSAKSGQEKKVYRLSPAWDIASLSEEVKLKQAEIKSGSETERDQAIDKATTRIWTSGKFKTEAKFLRMAGAGGDIFVHLTRLDGQTIKVPAEKLEDTDRAWIQDFKKATKKR